MSPTTKDVRRAFESNLSTVETENSDLAKGIRVTAHESEAGAFFQTLRVRGFNFRAKRIGDTLVAHVEAEEEQGLGQLFG